MKIRSWYWKEASETMIFQRESLGESEWPWLDIEIGLYVTGGASKMAEGGDSLE